jgi:hypothetical protein
MFAEDLASVFAWMRQYLKLARDCKSLRPHAQFEATTCTKRVREYEKICRSPEQVSEGGELLLREKPGVVLPIEPICVLVQLI